MKIVINEKEDVGAEELIILLRSIAAKARGAGKSIIDVVIGAGLLNMLMNHYEDKGDAPELLIDNPMMFTLEFYHVTVRFMSCPYEMFFLGFVGIETSILKLNFKRNARHKLPEGL